ncbi:putative integral membrane protein [Synechococcus sp. PCC 7502]|uniref:YggT family protein n=1 Tax=Synechococcus sp. PCC 7502 TaxID=1173263 RepID=UPI00029FE61C|nr:YggT family protein [Synechococcus sp. PCC 7502]AFY74352.1 putative integral membrane protein [Synechococcus sp. PCC 7502]
MTNFEIGTLILSLILGLMIFLNIFRIILSWYPQVTLTKFPFNLVYLPTEPLLFILRRLIPPIGGVDISPVIGVAIFSLIRELLLGQQGILTMMQFN